MQNTGSSLTGQ